MELMNTTKWRTLPGKLRQKNTDHETILVYANIYKTIQKYKKRTIEAMRSTCLNKWCICYRYMYMKLPTVYYTIHDIWHKDNVYTSMFIVQKGWRIYSLSVRFTWVLPWTHTLLVRLKPVLQVHVNAPSVFSHNWSHPLVDSSHSLISAWIKYNLFWRHIHTLVELTHARCYRHWNR